MSNQIANVQDAQSYSHVQNALGHLNNMNGVSYDINNPILKLRVIASSCFFGEPSYYEEGAANSQKSSSRKVSDGYPFQKYLSEMLNAQGDYFSFDVLDTRSLLEKQIDVALSYDAAATLQEAVRLRKEDNIRTTPQVILVRAANHESVRGSSLIRQFAQDIMLRADEPAVQLAYQLQAFGRKSIPNALKKAWKVFLEKQPELQLAKYRMENRKVKTVDVVNLAHAKSDEINKLMRGELKLSTQDTWEALISKNGSNSQTWTQAVDLMGHMALLRNLRNFKKNDVDMAPVWEKLVATAEKGKQLPFRYYSAATALKEASLIDKDAKASLSKCMNLSMGQIPKFKGRVMSLCDNSGSAQGAMTSEFGSVKVAEIANLSAVLTAKNSDEGYVGVFGDKLKVEKVSQDAEVFSTMDKINTIGQGIGGGTENGIWLFFDKAIKEKEHWDHIFVYSDMQAGHGGLYGTNPREYEDYRWSAGGGRSEYIDVAKLIKVYREKVNPNVHVYLVQVAGYGDSLVPEFYNKTYILGGWSAGLFKFAHQMMTVNELLENGVAPNMNQVTKKLQASVAKKVKTLSSEQPKKRSK